MGNRAHVVFRAGHELSPAVYLHWNGGPESVYAFLAELERREVRRDVSYAPARFVQLVGEFFGGTLSLGIVNGPRDESLKALAPFDHGDNGIYIVDLDNEAPIGDVMRRYVSRHGQLAMMSEEQTERERQTARSHKYAAGIAEQFAEMASEHAAA